MEQAEKCRGGCGLHVKKATFSDAKGEKKNFFSVKLV